MSNQFEEETFSFVYTIYNIKIINWQNSTYSVQQLRIDTLLNKLKITFLKKKLYTYINIYKESQMKKNAINILILTIFKVIII